MEDQGVEMFLDECADRLSDIPSDFEDSEIDLSDYELHHSSVHNESSTDAEDSKSIFLEKRKELQMFHSLVDSDESDQESNYGWTNDDPTRTNETFKCSEGPNILPKTKDKVEDVVSMFIGDDLLEFIALETNKYYNQHCQKNKCPQKSGKWSAVNAVELKKWLGLVIIMDLMKKSAINDYWSSNPILETPIFSKTMSRNRFRQILAFLHFSDNENMPPNINRLFKIKKIIDYFSKKFKENYNLGQNIFIRENIIPWCGKFGVRVCDSYSIKRGIFIRMLCDSTTGYISNFNLDFNTEQNINYTIMELLQDCLGKWHHLYVDNLYNNVKIAEELFLNKTRICGKMKSNYELSTFFKKQNLKTSDSSFARKGEVLLQLWKTNKKKDIIMISTIHNATTVNTDMTDKNTNCTIRKPICVIDYSQHMKGTDRVDQFLKYYPIYRKTKKWSKKVVLYLINCALFNAFKIYECLNASRKIKYHEFLLLLSKAWIEESNIGIRENQTPTTSRAPYHDSIQRLSGDLNQHQLIKISETDSRKRRRCRVCYANKIRKVTRLMCKSCKVPLHMGDCFANYHLKLNY